ncbi:MAG: translation elongation factor Ts [Chloroflexi bacterium]|nr:translation elongation factor Ts [Chloroflexota bacterium]
MTASAEQIKKLRELTGAGILDTKRTLEEFNGDFDKALAVLKEKGLKAAEKKAERVAKQGLIETYVHGAGKLGVMVEVNCETDFVAATNEFKQLAHDLALQIAATKPLYVSVNDVPADAVDAQKKVFADAALAEKKPANIVEKIVQGKTDAYLKEIVLLRQPFIRDDALTIQDLIQSVIAKLGENIVVRRFARFELGE